MRDTEIEKLRALVRQDRRARKGPFSSELRERLNTFLRERWESGESLRKLAKQLGLSDHTVQFWRSHWGERRRLGAQFRRVEVISETPMTTSLLTLYGPAGTRLEGLTADEVADLWRKLS